MGASPDDLVTDPSEQQPHRLMKIKCPAHAEKLSLFDLCTKKGYKSPFYLQHTDDKYELKKRNSYYYQNNQIQGQLHITRRNWCDFVVWIPSMTIDNLFVERIYYDDYLWSNTIHPQLH